MSNVGRLAVNGDGAMILASCFTHGIQRFDLKGRNEGSYHLGGTVSHAVPDFPGRTIAAATLEGELAIINSAGNVRWRTRLARPAIALEVDPLGRYVLYGHSTGEIVRLDLFGPGPDAGRIEPGRGGAAAAAAKGASPRTSTGSVRRPDWTVPAVTPTSRPRRPSWPSPRIPPRSRSSPAPIAWSSTRPTGQKLGRGPDMSGVGRILRTAPGWLAAATDRQIVLYDLRRNTQRRLGRKPGRADPSGDQARLVRPGARAGARPDRPGDSLGALGLEARAAKPGRGPGDRSRGLRGVHHQ